MSYTKLFQSIVTSTIWMEDDRTRIVWVTMLALADRHGEVMGSIPGIARIAGVPVEAAEAAIRKFMSPDPYSRTPEAEGRRIEAIDGGWAIINHAKYRMMASKEDEKSKAAERVRRMRDRNKALHTVTVTVGNGSVTDDADIADADADADSDKNQTEGGCVGFDEFWSAYPKKVAKEQAKAKWSKLNADDQKAAIEDVKVRSGSEQWTKDGGQFIPHPSTYLNQRRWESVVDIKPKSSGLMCGMTEAQILAEAMR